MRLFMAEDGLAGFALKGQDIVSVFAQNGAGAAAMQLAISAGGRTLDCFDTVLPEFYATHGFTVASRLKWDDEQAPSNWDKEVFGRYNGGEPDVVFMVFDPASKGRLTEEGRTFTGKNAYGRAVGEQQRRLKALQPGIKKVDKGDEPTEMLSIDAPDTPAFRKWFGKSKAVEAVNAETGRPVETSKEPKRIRPQVMFHTTRSADVGAFEVGRKTVNSTTFGDVETSRAAIFVTPDVEASQAYGTSGGQYAKGANVMPLFVRAENPLDVTGGVTPEVEEALVKAGLSRRYVINSFGGWDMFDDDSGKEVVEAIKKAGYDAVIFNDQNPDTGDSFEAWALFEPSQLKSATGNQGSFDAGQDDIRLSIDAPDTPAFRRWFGKSKVVDAEGKPLVVYHGTGSDTSVFSPQNGAKNGYGSPGIFFTASPRIAGQYAEDRGGLAWSLRMPNGDLVQRFASKQDAEQYRKAEGPRRGRIAQDRSGPNTVPAFLSLQKPLILDAKGAQWARVPVPDSWIEKLIKDRQDAEVERARKYSRKTAGALTRELNATRKGAEAYVRNTMGKQSTDAILYRARDEGYDGVIIHSVVDQISGEAEPMTIYAAFKPEQIKSAIGNRGTYDPADPDIRLSVDDDKPRKPGLRKLAKPAPRAPFVVGGDNQDDEDEERMRGFKRGGEISRRRAAAATN